jgi:hypothetical protein
MLDFLAPVAVLALMAYCLFDCLFTPEESIRNLPKLVWIIVILFPIFGALGWLVAGRPEAGRQARPTWAPGNGFPEASRPRQLAPDDDPAFLRQVKESAQDHEAMLKQWEADLRKREQGLRGEDDPEEPEPPRS